MADSEYSYEIITNENDARYCAQLLAEAFSAHNPITVFDQISAKQFYDECSWPMMEDALSEHLSILVRYRPTGEIVAATTAEDLYLQHKKKHLSERLNNPSRTPVNDLLDEMDELFLTRDFGQELKPNMVFHVGLSAVSAQHSGKGIANRMREILCDIAKEKGFEYMIVQTTNPATRHIYLNKMNGKEVTIIDPTTWLWKKNKNGLVYPYKDYKGGLIPNILIKL